MSSLFASIVPSRRRLLLAGVIGALAVTWISAGSARATGLLGIDTDPCDNAALTQPFAAFGDSSSYKLVPGGDFEHGLAGWTLSGGARTVADGEPFGATGSASHTSLYLPAGASVTSPYTCVDWAYPAFRLFAKNNGLLSTVLVSVVYKEPLVGAVAVPIGAVALNLSWGPSLKLLTASEVQGVVNSLLIGGVPQVALKFTAVTGSSEIDDVFVDPRFAK